MSRSHTFQRMCRVATFAQPGQAGRQECRPVIVKPKGLGAAMNNHFRHAAAAAALLLFGANYTSAALADEPPMVTKAPPVAVAPASSSTCTSLPDFFLSSCQLAWYGIRFYGTIDIGGLVIRPTARRSIRTSPPGPATLRVRDREHEPAGRVGPRAQRHEPVGRRHRYKGAGRPGGWAFVAKGELAFDPYSGLLANAPQAMQDAIGVPRNQQEIPVDFSRWGWLEANICRHELADLGNADFRPAKHGVAG